VRLRAAETEEIKLNMTSMIDIVFQLLVFFIMTFKVVDYEGDFSIKMPVSGPTNQEISLDVPDVLLVKLTADEAGNITNILVDDNPVDQNDLFGGLTRVVEVRLAGEGDPDLAVETEVEFDIQPNLKYAYTVAAIEAVSGKIEGETVKKLISKIKFKDNSAGLE
jgi:biopolymer transport protein ExbD